MEVPPSRSALIKRIKGKDTKPEKILRRALWASGYRYRLKGKLPSGRPDLLFPGKRVAVFIDGCFWHGCPDHYVRPRSRTEFWSAKLRANVSRDQRITQELLAAGWRVCRFWEHEIHVDLPGVMERIVKALEDPEWGPDDSWRVAVVVPLDGPGDLERRFMERQLNPREQREVVQKRHTRKWKVT